MQHIEAAGALIASDDVAHRVIADMAHMNAPRRIGEHFEDIIVGTRVVVPGRERPALSPDLLPPLLRLAGVITLNRHVRSLKSVEIRGPPARAGGTSMI